MAKENTSGLYIKGRLKKSGLTVYQRNGKMVARSAHSDEKRSNTRKQFVARQRMKHSMQLWSVMRRCNPCFDDSNSNYLRFVSLASQLPVVYTDRLWGSPFLMPGIPVSEGSLPAVEQQLGEAGGRAALLTRTPLSAMMRGDEMVLYTLVQRTYVNQLGLEANMARWTVDEWKAGIEHLGVVPTVVDGCMALTGDVLADDQRGWALVHVRPERGDRQGSRHSTQSIVTRCTLYQQYTTEEALQNAALSYGGLTD